MTTRLREVDFIDLHPGALFGGDQGIVRRVTGRLEICHHAFDHPV